MEARIATAQSTCGKTARLPVSVFHTIRAHALILDFVETLPTQRGLIGLLLVMRFAGGARAQTRDVHDRNADHVPIAKS